VKPADRGENALAMGTLGVASILKRCDNSSGLRGTMLDVDALGNAISTFMLARAMGSSAAEVDAAANHIGTTLSLVLRRGLAEYLNGK
jgi:hypothetical protein